MDSRTTILIADDHPVVRKGLREIIEEDPALVVVGEASNGEEALRLITELRPDVAIIDINMPEMSGLLVARSVKRQELPTRVIFLTFQVNEDVMRNAIESGGRGYLLKGSELEDISKAIHAVLAGQTYIGSMVTGLLSEKRAVPVDGKLIQAVGKLTSTEKKVLLLLADGKSSKEIGTDLAINRRTVENHRTNICQKLGLEGSNALARYVLQHQLALQRHLQPLPLSRAAPELPK